MAYGSLPESERFAAGDPQGRTILLMKRNQSKRWIIGSLAVLTALVTLAVSLSQNNKAVVLCDAATCLSNSPVKPPGIFGDPPAPRILSPNEMTKLKQALEEEELLEAEVRHIRMNETESIYLSSVVLIILNRSNKTRTS